MVQSFYPAYAINVNMVEIVENSEELKSNLVKKPIISDISVFHFGHNILDYHNSKTIILQNELSKFKVFLDIIVPPPKA